MTTLGSNTTVNNFHGDKFRVVFSNIPGMDSMLDMQLYNNFIKSLELPEFSQEFAPDNFKGSVIWHPISQNNDQLSSLSIEFKLSENMENYYNLFHWMHAIRYCQPEFKTSFREMIRRNTVKSIDILFLDNEKRAQKKMTFKECFISGLGSIPLIMGNSDEITFTSTWQFQEVLLVDA